LQEFVKARLCPERIAAELGQSLDSIKHKMRRLGLEVVGFEKFFNAYYYSCATERTVDG